MIGFVVIGVLTLYMNSSCASLKCGLVARNANRVSRGLNQPTFSESTTSNVRAYACAMYCGMMQYFASQPSAEESDEIKNGKCSSYDHNE